VPIEKEEDDEEESMMIDLRDPDGIPIRIYFKSRLQ